MTGPRFDDLLRDLAPQVVSTLTRQYGRFEAVEDATQEALLTAFTQWPAHGVPESPRAWLLTTARRNLIDQWRSETARRGREETVEMPSSSVDDTLILLFLCCHPLLDPPAQIALTLRAVGGLTTAEIARALLVPEDTMAKRISRAKRRIAGTGFEMPSSPGVQPVLAVLYLIFNEGYTASWGKNLHRVDLSGEAIRLTRLLHRIRPADGEVAGLLALMLLTDARRPARTRPDGSLVPLHEQDRSTWDSQVIREGIRLLTATLGRHPIGQYQLQAAVAALHDEAPTAAATDWPQILALYETLEHVAPSPMVTLSRAVAVAMVHGPLAGLALVGMLEGDDRAARSHRLSAVRAHLLEMAGEPEQARAEYLRAARMTASVPEQQYLQLRAAELGRDSAAGSWGFTRRKDMRYEVGLVPTTRLK